LSDGEQVFAFRFASDELPPTLYVGQCEQGSIVASEPLDSLPDHWRSVPANGWVRMSASGTTLHA
jgi:glutamine amidotransferase